MKSINTLFLNLIQRIKNAVTHSDENLQIAKDYTDARGDYVVEERQNGNWLCRKWASGYMELYGNVFVTVAMTNNIATAQYWGNYTCDVAEYGFTAWFSITVSGQASGHYFGTKIESFNVSTGKITVSSRASASTTTAVRFFFNIKGLWKALEQVGGVIANLLTTLSRKAVTA